MTEFVTYIKSGVVDIAEIYIELFGNKAKEFLPNNYPVSVEDILNYNIDTLEIIDNELPLLNKTLVHSFTYLYLRLLVEKYKIDTNRYSKLGDIIVAAFPNDNDITQIRKRVYLTSKKNINKRV